MTTAAQHGGVDARGAVRWDFSTNVNAAGPCPLVVAALRAVDVARYPDPAHHALRERLAAWHGVQVQRILLAASGSEFIQRMTAVSARLVPGAVAVPRHAYGDYARAASACGRAVVVERACDAADASSPGDQLAHPQAHPQAHLQAHPQADAPQHAPQHAQVSRAAITLRWCAEPSSPLGQDAAPPPDLDAVPTVLDAVYAPLRLQGQPLWDAAARDRAFVLHSPNKALGLAGVRGAYAVAPAGPHWTAWVDALQQALPSWPLGAHGVALLDGWCSNAAQQWLAASLPVLGAWKASQQDALHARNISSTPSVTPFFCARMALDAQRLRAAGVLLRDATSFGLPGWWRLSAQPPAAQHALTAALGALQ